MFFIILLFFNFDSGPFIFSELLDGISFVQAGDKITRWEGPTVIHVQRWIWWVIYDLLIVGSIPIIGYLPLPDAFPVLHSKFSNFISWSSQEVRAVERRILLETLANQLPADAISFSSRLATITRTETGETLLQLDDGTRLLAKVAYSTVDWMEKCWILCIMKKYPSLDHLALKDTFYILLIIWSGHV